MEQSVESHLHHLEAQIKRLKLVQYLTIAMNTTSDDKELLEMMIDQCILITNSVSGSIMSRIPGTNLIRFEVYRGLPAETVESTTIKIGEGITGLVVQEGVPKIVNNITLEPKYITVRSDIQSEMAVPLIINGDVIGVISVDHLDQNAYSENDLELLQTISNQAAQIIARNRLYQNLERKIKLKDVLLDISTTVENIIELKDVFDILIKKLTDNLSLTRGMLVLFENPEMNLLSVFTAYNLLPEEISRGVYKVGEGIIGKVVESGKPISISDVSKDEHFLNRMQVKRDKNIPISFIAIPIKIEGVVSGVLAIEKPFESVEVMKDEEDIIFLIGNIISNKVKIYHQLSVERKSLLEENTQLRKELTEKYQFSNIIGKNGKMIDVFELIKMVADSNSSILLHGESGTGKELVARSIHYNSSRRDKPFVSINCAAIPENLLESELFGYKKGAFTGANSDKKGKFQLANEGTLFLDEIGDMPLYLQAKLLRAIQEREIEPIGSESKIKVDIRIVSATNKDLTKEIKDGNFRKDLYYRLNVIEISIPPLRERKDDIPLLVTHFIQKYNERNGRNIDRISPEAIRVLQSYNWPGNVRELENIIERSVLLARTNVIETTTLPSFMVSKDNIHVTDIGIGKWIESHVKNHSLENEVHSHVIGKIEKELITQALIYNKRNKVKTAEFLGINRNTLRAKMTDYGINV